jgi:hypothetical protein
MLLTGWEDKKWNHATRKPRLLLFFFLTTAVVFTAIGIFFPAAVDTLTIIARWRMDLVNGSAIRCLDLEGGDPKETILPHSAKFLPTRGDSSLLVAAALATTKGAAEWTVDSDYLGLGD